MNGIPAAETASDTIAPDEERPLERDTGWTFYHGKQVMLQLREPYVGLKYPSHTPEIAEGGGVRAVPILTGALFVAPGAKPGEVMLMLRYPVSERDMAVTTVHPDAIDYCTHVVEP